MKLSKKDKKKLIEKAISSNKPCANCKLKLKKGSVIHYGYWFKSLLTILCSEKCLKKYTMKENFKCQCIDKACNDCKYFNRETMKVITKTHHKKYMLFGYVGKVWFGRCSKFNKEVITKGNICESNDCFEHRDKRDKNKTNKSNLCEAEVRKNLVLAELGRPLTLPLKVLNRNCEFSMKWNEIQNKWHGEAIDVTEIKARNKARNKVYNQRPEIKARNKAYSKAYNQRPEIKARSKVYNQRPEIKARNKARDKVYNKAYNQRKNLERLNKSNVIQ